MQLAVATRSLLETQHRPESIRVHILWEHLEESDLEKLTESWRPWLKQITFYQMSDQIGEKALDGSYGFWFRAWLHKVLPGTIERVLYLDYDILVLDDLTPLWELPLENRLVAAVPDPGSRLLGQALARYSRSLGLDFEEDSPYFNTGVMMINLKRWRELDIGSVLDSRFSDLRPHPSLEGPAVYDQTELNLLYRDDFLAISPEWNLVEVPPKYSEWDLELYRDLADPTDYFQPKIIHFAGSNKAYDRWRRAGEKEIFYSVLDRTAWKGWRSSNDRSLVGRLLSQFLEFHYVVCRGIDQNAMPDYRARLWRLTQRNPILPLLYLVALLNRLRWKLLEWWSAHVRKG